MSQWMEYNVYKVETIWLKFVYDSWQGFRNRVTFFNLCLIYHLKFQELDLSYNLMHRIYAKAIGHIFVDYKYYKHARNMKSTSREKI